MRHLLDVILGRATLGWFGSLTALSQFLALLTVPSVLLQRQGRPRAALSWLLALFALPAIGLVAWWAFGRTTMERKRRRRVASAREFATRYGPAHSEADTPFDVLVPRSALGDSIFTSGGNAVELLFDGPSAFPAMEGAIRGATRTVHLMFYIFRDDETGRRFRDLLVECARRGVVVRVLVDGWGSPRFMGSFSKPLRDAGVHTAAFLPSHFLPWRAPRFNFVNHRKLIVVDESTAFVGGMNLSDEYVRSWRDVMARLQGPVVRALEHVFLDDWYFASGHDVSPPASPALVPTGNVACAVIASGPDRESYIHDAYFNLFTHATQRIWIVTPYFIPTDSLTTALRTASGRGVDVRVLLPLTSDVGIVKHAARSYYPYLLAAQVRIYEYAGPMLHAKAFVVDDDLSAFGSANVDTRSFRLSFEIGCLLKDRAKNRETAEWYSGLLDDSHEVTLAECEGRPTVEKIFESAAHLLSPML